MSARLNPQAAVRIREVLQGHVDSGLIPGAVALVALGGETCLFETLGRRDPAAPDAMRTDTVFRIYSMTKPVVSLAALMLVEQGRLLLTDPVSKHLPMFAGQQVLGADGKLVAAAREATVQDLLRHTAGFTYEFMGDGPVHRQYAEAALASHKRSNLEFCEALAAIPLAFQPGSCWEYSRATDVLGALLEVVAGQPLGALLSAMVLAPLGMKDTGFSLPEAAHGRMAEPFAADPQTGEAVVLMPNRRVPRFESAGGGLLSTAADYARFLLLLRNRGSLDGVRLLSPQTLAWMTADHLGAIPVRGDLLAPGNGFGLGFAVRTDAGVAPTPGSVGSYFWSGLGGTSFFVDPAQDLFAMLLTQAPGQREFFIRLWRQLVYGALD
ncbi:serine hydrolase domain-containing protein [Caenimonas terrae]|uniref:Serine hydrolase domain-containing protein n=1 Tax=Caenimonas terrae TaxID=696074 RepID=A0ABW0NDH1_9BURK